MLILNEPAQLTLYKLCWIIGSLWIHLKLWNKFFNPGYSYTGKEYARVLQNKAVERQIKEKQDFLNSSIKLWVMNSELPHSGK